MSARAGIVVTGTEVLTGRISDRNGPWLADRLLELGVELAHITICGDRPEDIESQLRFLASDGVDLIITSGGLGPTADDMTVEVVARASPAARLILDEALEARIAEILRPLMRRFRHWDPEAARAANKKQALVPEGAFVIDPVGTAPGVVVPGEPVIVVLPGPPRELQPMWGVAAATDIVQAALAGRTSYLQRTARLFGMPESAIAETLREAEDAVEGFERLEITTCLRRGRGGGGHPLRAGRGRRLRRVLDLVSRRHPRELFSSDGASVDDQVADLLSGRRIATAESCTAGLIASRLTERPGSSAYVVGGVVAYANEAKTELLGVDPGLIERHGAVSEQVAEAMAEGALARFGADTAVSVTGVAGPDGGTPEKPVGTVCWSVRLGEGRSLTRTVLLPGDRADIRDRATTVAFHLLRRAAARRGGRGALSGPRARMFVALDLPEAARDGAGPLARPLAGGPPRSACRGTRGPARDAGVPRLAGRVGGGADQRRGLRRGLGGDAAATARPRWESARCPPRAPRLFALDLEDSGGRAVALQAAVSSALEAGALVPARETPVLASRDPRAGQARCAAGPVPRGRPAPRRALRSTPGHALPLDAAPAGSALRAARAPRHPG